MMTGWRNLAAPMFQGIDPFLKTKRDKCRTRSELQDLYSEFCDTAWVEADWWTYNAKDCTELHYELCRLAADFILKEEYYDSPCSFLFVPVERLMSGF